MRRRPRPAAGVALAALLLGVFPAASAAAATSTPSPTPSPTSAATSSPTSSATPTPTTTPTPSTTPSPTAGPTVVDPLRVVIRHLQPAALPESPRRRITVAGTVSNLSDTPWTDLQAYLVTSAAPLTSPEELTAAVSSDPRGFIGNRVTRPGLYEALPDLAPGASTPFTLTVRRRDLVVSGEPGVYWLGVQVLATSATGERDGAADGRARTFYPYVPSGTVGTELAVGAQFRARVVRNPDGTLASPDPLDRRLRSDGRLHRLLALSRTAPPGGLSWVVDPALVEAVGSLAAGDPPYDSPKASLSQLDAAASGGPSASPSAGASGSPSGSPGDRASRSPSSSPDPSPTAGPTAGGQGSGGQADPVVRRAAHWLTGWTEEASRHEVLALPYGDLDVASAYSHARATLSTYALGISADVLRALGISAEPAVAPPTGYLPAGVLTSLAPDVLTVLAPEAVPAQPRPLLQTPSGATVLVAGTGATTRGPSPGATRAALAVRQRLLAESALHALSADRGQPVVALLPAWWDPGPQWQSAHFFDGLRQPWLDLVDLADVRRGARSSELPLPEGLTYPAEAAAAELPGYVLRDTDALITQGATYESVFIDVQSVGDRLGRQALLSSSFWSRAHPRLAADRAQNAHALVEVLLDRVEVRSPTFVTLSSGDGDFLVTLANGLGERIRVGLQAKAVGRGLQLTTPGPVTLEPHERRSVHIAVRSSGIGVHRVVLQPTTAAGLPIGHTAALNVRSSSIGLVLWLIMAAGAVVLFGAIAVRLVRRVQRRRRTHGPVLVDGARGDRTRRTSGGVA